MSISYFDDLTPTGRPSQPGEPTWELTTFFPRQGEWTEGEYLALETRGGRLVELVDGKLEVLPMPTFAHQLILAYLHDQLRAFVLPRGLGLVGLAPCPIRLAEKHFREPDVFFAGHARIRDLHTPPEGVDLAVEIVSPGEKDRKRDLVEKRKDYAQAGIPEYWIVDPPEQRITVLVLEGEQYRVDGEFQPGQTARSKLLEGLEIDVAAVFAAGESQPK
ncbi:MAG: Uma2 family endonuclease [Pirellulaceae bacterium]